MSWKRHFGVYCLAFLGGLNFTTSAMTSATASEPSPVQSPVRPMGVQAYAPVQLTGSDSRSADFNENYLPYFRQLINEKLSESSDFTEREGFRLDASRLFLRTRSDETIRVYFVHEGAGYHNTLGFNMTPAGAATPGTPYLIFPDASFHGTHSSKRTTDTPLVVGDFVDLSEGGPGIQLDFFLFADGARRPNNPIATWYNTTALNVDGKQHVVAFLLPDTRYLLIGFEDLYNGGDLDYNDCLFVVDIGEINAENLFDDSTLPN